MSYFDIYTYVRALTFSLPTYSETDLDNMAESSPETKISFHGSTKQNLIDLSTFNKNGLQYILPLLFQIVWLYQCFEHVQSKNQVIGRDACRKLF